VLTDARVLDGTAPVSSAAGALLHPASVAWLDAEAAGLATRELGSPAFRAAWARYTGWLHEPAAAESDEAFTAAPSFV
jgi:hypothetical protein